MDERCTLCRTRLYDGSGCFAVGSVSGRQPFSGRRYIAQLFGAGGNFWDSTAAECLAGSYVMLALAVVFSCPVVRWIADKLKLQEQSRKNIAAIAAVPLFLLCIAKCMSSSYNPFIYFNF